MGPRRHVTRPAVLRVKIGAQRGWSVTAVEEGPDVGRGAWESRRGSDSPGLCNGKNDSRVRGPSDNISPTPQRVIQGPSSLRKGTVDSTVSLPRVLFEEPEGTGGPPCELGRPRWAHSRRRDPTGVETLGSCSGPERDPPTVNDVCVTHRTRTDTPWVSGCTRSDRRCGLTVASLLSRCLPSQLE